MWDVGVVRITLFILIAIVASVAVSLPHQGQQSAIPILSARHITYRAFFVQSFASSQRELNDALRNRNSRLVLLPHETVSGQWLAFLELECARLC